MGIRAAVLLAALAIPQLASAVTAVCVGKVTTIANHANGQNGLVVVINTNPAVRVCSFTAAQFTVTPEDCKHMASIAALAFAMDTNVVLYVDNAASTDCTLLANYFISNTRFFGTER
jgi:hypothetical protein